MKYEIPLLNAGDVELRVAQLQQTNYGTYVNLICYKDARCDMRMLDAVFGPMNWKRSHEVIDGKLFCTVSIWDDEKKQWISKQDVGVESNTEATKGQASDAFKRACFNIGIGRELYNAPDIRFKLNENEVYTGSNGRPKTYAKFYIGEMEYDKCTGVFTSFKVLDASGNVRYNLQGNQRSGRVESEKPGSTQGSPQSARQENMSSSAISTRNDGQFRCSECNTVIKSPKVAEYSMNNYGRPLCYACQKKLAA